MWNPRWHPDTMFCYSFIQNIMSRKPKNGLMDFAISYKLALPYWRGKGESSSNVFLLVPPKPIFSGLQPPPPKPHQPHPFQLPCYVTDINLLYILYYEQLRSPPQQFNRQPLSTSPPLAPCWQTHRWGGGCPPSHSLASAAPRRLRRPRLLTLWPACC